MKREMKWRVQAPKSKVDSIQKLVSILLRNRGLNTKKDRDIFFNPEDPSKMPLKSVGLNSKNVKYVIERLKKSRSNKEKILIYGDYDADGISATAILWECLYDLDFDCIPYIPDRFSDGYGINENSVERIKSKHKDLGLIITVDNGVVAYDGIKRAKKHGIDVIITDHHEADETYPDAEIVVHSQQIGGAGIAWFLSREIKKAFDVADISKGIDLAAIGTVTDQIPLIGPNRSIVAYGLEVLNRKERIGLVELYKTSGLMKYNSELVVDTYTIGFVIGPRLNAMGRLEHAIDSLRLLCTRNKSRALELARYLEKTNKKRQEVVEEVISHAKHSAKSLKNDRVIVLAHESYHEGVVGLAASKLVEEFYKPAIVFSILGKDSKASARSVSGFNIIDAIRNFDDMLLAAGGHPMAAGVKIATEKITDFSKKINKHAKTKLGDKVLAPELKVDVSIPFALFSWKLIDILHDFAPFGSGNSRPLFMTNGVEVEEVKTVGRENNHLKLKLREGKKSVDAIAFGFGYLASRLKLEDTIDITYSLEENDYRGVKSMQLKVKDIKLN